MTTSQWQGYNSTDGALAHEMREWAMLVYKHPETLDMHEVVLEGLSAIECGWEMGEVGIYEVSRFKTFSGRPEIFSAPIPEVAA